MRQALRQSWEPIVASGATVDPRRALPALLRPRLQPRPRPDLRGQHRPGHARGPHVPARRPRAAGPRRVLAVPAEVRQSSTQRAAAGTGSRRGRTAPRAGCSSGASPGLFALAAFAPSFDADGIALFGLRAAAGRCGGPPVRRPRAATSTPAQAAPPYVLTPEDGWRDVADAAGRRRRRHRGGAVQRRGGRAPHRRARRAGRRRRAGPARRDPGRRPDSEAAQSTSRRAAHVARGRRPRCARRRPTASDLDTQETCGPRPAGDRAPRAGRDHRRARRPAALAAGAGAARRDRGARSTAATVGVAALVFDGLLRLPGQRPRRPADRLSCSWWRWGSTTTSS